jgi:hypothetical protein
VIRCIAFEPDEQNTRQGYVALELTKVGLIIRRCIWHKEGEKEWISFYAHCHEREDGTVKWEPIVQFAKGAEKKLFRALALQAVHTFVAKQGQQANDDPFFGGSPESADESNAT